MTALARNEDAQRVDQLLSGILLMKGNDRMWSEASESDREVLPRSVAGDSFARANPRVRQFQLVPVNVRTGVSVPEQVVRTNFDVQTFLNPNATAVFAVIPAQAEAWFASARTAAKAGDLRAAYRNVYRGLDILLKNAQWPQVAAELQELCSNEYPVAFAVGAMRFVSSASERIPYWEIILERLKKEVQRQNKDVRRTLRGLVEGNGAK